MKFILINGSSCSGKSTIVRNILTQGEHLFHLSYDSLKWSFSQYSPNKQFTDVQSVMLSVAETVFTLKYDVICDSGLFKEWREKLINLAEKHGYEILEINLEADPETLSKRFNERMQEAQIHPERKISNLSKERFMELCEIYQKEKNPSAIVLRTDQQTIEKTVEDILKIF
jgi:predicted kinase